MSIKAKVIGFKLARQKSQGSYIALIQCPYCGKTHLHGVGEEDVGKVQHRISHCSGKNGEYKFVLKNEMIFA